MKANIFIILVVILFSTNYISAQISQGGKPASFARDNMPPLVFEKMPYIDLAKLHKQDKQNDTKNKPWRFGKNINTELNMHNSGMWYETTEGDKIWQLGIESPGALSLNFLFDVYIMPENAKLFIYSEDKKHILGAFTNFNNRPDSIFATTLIPADKVIIEYNEPAYCEFTAELNIARVTHGYRGVSDYVKNFGDSKSCNVNVACPQADAPDNQIRSIAMLISGGNGFCSGALINNTKADGKPYFLSAQHCYCNPATVVYWFNWQSETCTNPSYSPHYNSISGSRNLAYGISSDFWLVELSSAPPDSFRPYYSGWDRSSDTLQTGKFWCIHHPSGDIKKISWTNNDLETAKYLQEAGSGTSHWVVNSWSDGTTTEPGSSGAPLFNDKGLIVGQLHGGYASCENPTASDWFGRISTSWIGNGTEASSLRNWLDPINSGQLQISGYDPFAVPYDIDAKLVFIEEPEFEYSSEQVINPKVIIKNNGTMPLSEAKIIYTINQSAEQTINWQGMLSQGETTDIIFPEIDLKTGNYEFKAEIIVAGDEYLNNNSQSRTVKVVDCAKGVELPYLEDFETGNIPVCWHLEYVKGDLNWKFITGNGSQSLSNAQSGFYNACFKAHTDTDKGKITRLVSSKPKIPTNNQNLQISFYFQNEAWGKSQDILRLFYKDAFGNWNFLKQYNGNTSKWTSDTVLIINELVSDSFQLAFEGEIVSRHGICIDELRFSAVDDNSSDNSCTINVYPNPTAGFLWLEFDYFYPDIEISLENLAGQTLFHKKNISGKRASLSLYPYPSGLYLLKIKHLRATEVFKIFKQF